MKMKEKRKLYSQQKQKPLLCPPPIGKKKPEMKMNDNQLKLTTTHIENKQKRNRKCENTAT